MARHLRQRNIRGYCQVFALRLHRLFRRWALTYARRRGGAVPRWVTTLQTPRRKPVRAFFGRRFWVQMATAIVLIACGSLVIKHPLETGRLVTSLLRAGWECGVAGARWIKDELYPSLVFSLQANEDIPAQLLEAGLPRVAAGSEPIDFDLPAMVRQLVTTVTNVDLYEVESILEAQFLGSDFELPAYMTERAPDPALLPKESAPKVEVVPERAKGDQPLVAIYHTHSSEMYHGRDQHTKGEQFFAGDYCWGQDLGVISVGDELARILAEEYKIPVVHSRQIHDYPVFRDAYTNSRLTLENILRQYPSVQIVLDIHRDGLTKPPETAIATTVAGEMLARVAIVVGKGRVGFSNPHWEDNHRLATRLHQAMERLYPGLSRGIVVKDWPYNQELHPQAILLEIGDHYNTREEAIKSARLVADALATLLN